MSHYIGSLLICSLFLVACDSDLAWNNELNRKKGNIEKVEDVTLQYTDSGRLQVLLKTSEILRFNDVSGPHQEFTKGIYCEFYDDSLQLKATLVADYAIRDESSRMMTARQNVKLVSADSSQLESEELIWDEGLRIIYTNKFVKFSRGKEVSTGFFFKADQEFKKIEYRNTEADNIRIN